MKRTMPPPHEPALVFVVDDDESVRDALARQIGLLGYRVECFSAPEDVLVRVESRLGDCLLVDLVMPGMNGLELQSALAGRGPLVQQRRLARRTGGRGRDRHDLGAHDREGRRTA
jgi:CheY-like chemotaxis protein